MAVEVFLFRVKLGVWWRVILNESTGPSKQELINLIELLYQPLFGFKEKVINALWLSLLIGSWAWAWSLFDMYGSEQGLWVAVVMGLFPLLVIAEKFAFERMRSSTRSSVLKDSTGLEITKINQTFKQNMEEIENPSVMPSADA